jgi:type 1 glutamine amidotransferase
MIRKLLVVILLLSCGAGNEAQELSKGSVLNILVFSKTNGYRHESIPTGIRTLIELGESRRWQITATEDHRKLSESFLGQFHVLVFMNTNGDVLEPVQQDAVMKFYRSGKGFVGVHSASATEYDWPWYETLIGAYFKAHPKIQQARIIMEDKTHPALPDSFGREIARVDEWYSFRKNPRGDVDVLLSLDETSYDFEGKDDMMMGDHPIAWYHEKDGGRSFYTALGHTHEIYADPFFRAHLAGAIEWAGGIDRMN